MFETLIILILMALTGSVLGGYYSKNKKPKAQAVVTTPLPKFKPQWGSSDPDYRYKNMVDEMHATNSSDLIYSSSDEHHFYTIKKLVESATQSLKAFVGKQEVEWLTHPEILPLLIKIPQLEIILDADVDPLWFRQKMMGIKKVDAIKIDEKGLQLKAHELLKQDFIDIGYPPIPELIQILLTMPNLRFIFAPDINQEGLQLIAVIPPEPDDATSRKIVDCFTIDLSYFAQPEDYFSPLFYLLTFANHYGKIKHPT